MFLVFFFLFPLRESWSGTALCVWALRSFSIPGILFEVLSPTRMNLCLHHLGRKNFEIELTSYKVRKGGVSSEISRDKTEIIRWQTSLTFIQFFSSRRMGFKLVLNLGEFANIVFFGVSQYSRYIRVVSRCLYRRWWFERRVHGKGLW